MLNRSQKKSLPLSDVYRHLEPGPVVLLTTVRDGVPNVMTMSWHTMLDFEPPLVGCVVSNRDYSFESLRMMRECVINIPTVELAKIVVGCGNTSGRKVDKFKKFGLTPVGASLVEAPLIGECYANFECKLIDQAMADKYNFFVLEVIKAWKTISQKPAKTIHHLGKGRFMVAGRIIKLRSKMK